MAEPSDRAADVDPTAYWGYLFHQNKCPTEKLDRLLKGIAACISRDIMPHDSADLKPAQLAAFYRRVGGQYDPLFLDMPAQSIAYIYKSLGCLHSLQPDPAADDGPYASPSVPALKSVGFVTWQTIQLLLGPEEHVPFVQNALKEFDVRDPVDGKPFPAVLPREAFPLKPDQKMVEWHEGVSERLRLEAIKEIEYSANMESGKHAHDRSRSGSAHRASNNSTLALKHDSEDRAQAASYFSNPFNKNKDGRPGVVRTITKAPQRVMRGGKTVAATAGRTLRNVVDPHLWSGDGHRDHDRDSRERARDRRRKSTGDSDYSSASPLPDRDMARRHNATRTYPDRSPEDAPNADRFSRSPREDRKYPIRPTPAGPSPRDVREGRPPRRHRSGSPSSSPDAPNGRRPRHYAAPSPHTSQPHPRRHRSQEPLASPRDYFDDWQRARPQQHQQPASGHPRQQVPANQLRPRPNSQHEPGRHQPPPQIRRPDRSFDVDNETDSTDSDLDGNGPWEHGAHVSHNSHFTASTSPATAAKVSHARGASGGASGGGLQPEDPYASRPSPAEYRPIDERIGGSRYASSSNAPAGNSHGKVHHGPRAHFADDPLPSPTHRATDPYPIRRGSTSPVSPGTDALPEKDQYDLTQPREGSRQRIPRGPGPLLYGELPLSGESGEASDNIAGSPMRTYSNGPRRVTPVEGVKGRRYAHEVAWPGGSA